MSVTISGERYRELLQSEAQLNILEAWGVDNWEGYHGVPDINDFPSLPEWQVRVNKAMEDDGW